MQQLPQSDVKIMRLYQCKHFHFFLHIFEFSVKNLPLKCVMRWCMIQSGFADNKHCEVSDTPFRKAYNSKLGSKRPNF